MALVFWFFFVSCWSSSQNDEDDVEIEELPEKTLLTTLSRVPSLSGQLPSDLTLETLRQVSEMVNEQGEKAPPQLVTTYLFLMRASGQNVPPGNRLSQWVFQASDYFPLLMEVIYLKLLQNRFPEVRYYLGRAKKAAKGKDSYLQALAHVNVLIELFKQNRAAAFEEMKKIEGYPPARLMLGQGALAAGFWQKAKTLFSNPSASSQMGLATCEKFLGNSDQAVSILGPLFKKRPDKRVYWNLLLTLSNMPGREGDLLALEKESSNLIGIHPQIDERLRGADAIFRAARERKKD